MVNPCIVSLNMKSNIQTDISESSLKIKKERINNMSYQTNYNQEGYGLVEVVPSGEKIFTITMPHLGYIGRSSVEDSDGFVEGKETFSALKLIAYNSMLQALYLHGDHHWKHEFLLTNLHESLNISSEEHSIELRHITRCHFD